MNHGAVKQVYKESLKEITTDVAKSSVSLKTSTQNSQHNTGSVKVAADFSINLPFLEKSHCITSVHEAFAPNAPKADEHSFRDAGCTSSGNSTFGGERELDVKPVAKFLGEIGLQLVGETVFKSLYQYNTQQTANIEESVLSSIAIVTAQTAAAAAGTQLLHHVQHRCKRCSFVATTRNGLQYHLATGHTRITKHGSTHVCCCVCRYSTRSLIRFIRHMHEVHQINTRPEYLYRHHAKITGPIHPCPLCYVNFGTVLYASKHLLRCKQYFDLNVNLAPTSQDSDIPVWSAPYKTKGTQAPAPNSASPAPTGEAYNPVRLVQAPFKPLCITDLQRGCAINNTRCMLRPVYGLPPGVQPVRLQVNNALAIREPMQKFSTALLPPFRAFRPPAVAAGPCTFSSLDSSSHQLTTKGSSPITTLQTSPVTATRTSLFSLFSTVNSNRHQLTTKSSSPITTLQTSPVTTTRTSLSLCAQPSTIIIIRSRSSSSSSSTKSVTNRVMTAGCGDLSVNRMPASDISQSRSTLAPPSPISKASVEPAEVVPTPYTCELCDNSFEADWPLFGHFNYSHGFVMPRALFFGSTKLRKESCEFCAENYFTMAGLDRHLRAHHLEKQITYKCKCCTKDRIVDIVNHLSTEHYLTPIDLWEKRYCYVCGISLVTIQKLQTHLLVDHRNLFTNNPRCIPVDPVKTIVSKPVASEAKALVDQSPIGTAELGSPNIESVVPNGVGRSDVVREVVPTPDSHEREELLGPRKRQFTCSSCGRRFLSGDMLKRHEKSNHLFSCFTCLKKFPSKLSMRRHWHCKSDDDRRLDTDRCPLCTQVVRTGRPMIRHMKLSHIRDCAVVISRLDE